jgi:uncharacterized OB-fold protein
MAEELDSSVQTDDVKSEYKYPFHWDLDFSLNIGEDNRKFFDAIEDKRILGKQCPECGATFVPPQSVCVECYVETDEWVEVEQHGVVESYTVCFFDFSDNLPEPPYITAAIRVDDSDICMLHFIDDIEYDGHDELVEKLHKGTEVEPVWADEREGDIRDISHWRPLE